MTYLDNAATSWPKPPDVASAIVSFLEHGAGNPGRGTHRIALEAGRLVERTRAQLAALFGVTNPGRIVLTCNTTVALNMAIKGLTRPGSHVVTTTMEHNSVNRPLHALATRAGVRVDWVEADPEGRVDADQLISRITPDTSLVVMTHASNVCGTIQPVGQIGAACRRMGVPFLVDAAQTAGLFPIRVEELGISLLAFPGHKGLLGPTGTGGLYIAPGIDLAPLFEGGTGTQSASLDQPAGCPDRFEAGTANTVGLAGLAAALAYLERVGIDTIRSHEQRLATMLRAGLAGIPGVRVVGPQADAARDDAPVVAAVVDRLDGGEVALRLDHEYDIAVRPGLHCAPWAHRTLGTFDTGAIRFSPGAFTTDAEIEHTITAMGKIAASAGKPATGAEQ